MGVWSCASCDKLFGMRTLGVPHPTKLYMSCPHTHPQKQPSFAAFVINESAKRSQELQKSFPYSPLSHTSLSPPYSTFPSLSLRDSCWLWHEKGECWARWRSRARALLAHAPQTNNLLLELDSCLLLWFFLLAPARVGSSCAPLPHHDHSTLLHLRFAVPGRLFSPIITEISSKQLTFLVSFISR